MEITVSERGIFKALYVNDSYLGHVYIDTDGYHKINMPELNGLSAELLHAVAGKLDELNSGWDKKINNDPQVSEKAHKAVLFGEWLMQSEYQASISHPGKFLTIRVPAVYYTVAELFEKFTQTL